VRQALLGGQVHLARRLLGRSYSLAGEIVHGTATGSNLRVPTANLRTDNELIPRMGVYVTTLTIEGRKLPAVTNVGVRPTVVPMGAEAPLTIETHVLDYDRDLYGIRVTLDFLLRLRDERRFEDKQALVAQIRRDVARSRRWFSQAKRVAPGLLED
jgi:riboflavin kinase/FMN adenylyltransferase